MKNLKNKKGFTLVELLAVIVVLAIVMGLAVVGITSVLDSTRKSAMVADAKSFIDGARNLVTSDEMNSLLDPSISTNYSVRCNGTSGETKYIPLSAIKLQQGGEKSPYGNLYLKGALPETGTPEVDTNTNSYIKVVASYETDSKECKYSYSIFLSDGIYSIGGTKSPVSFGELDTGDVSPLNAG